MEKILIEDYALKVEAFFELWREQMISDIELVEAITKLGKEVVIIDPIPSIQIKSKE